VSSGIRNIRLTLAFDGTNYCGWQRQKEMLSVQQVVEEAIATMSREQVNLQGAGRTDAGVHALGMVANFHTASTIPCPGFFKGLNSLLPTDIRVLKASEAEPAFHARKSASGKTYMYHICNTVVQLPTERLYSTHIPNRLNIDAIRACLDRVTGTHDFSSFEAVGSRDTKNDGGRGAVREIFAGQVLQLEKSGRIAILLTGDGFLRHMVRNITGTVIEAGKGKISPDDFAAILRAKDRTCAGPTAPAHGLFLKEVYYPED
jgi:tRNA pseudouridine38-40 synthase